MEDHADTFLATEFSPQLLTEQSYLGVISPLGQYPWFAKALRNVEASLPPLHDVFHVVVTNALAKY